MLYSLNKVYVHKKEIPFYYDMKVAPLDFFSSVTCPGHSNISVVTFSITMAPQRAIKG